MSSTVFWSLASAVLLKGGHGLCLCLNERAGLPDAPNLRPWRPSNLSAPPPMVLEFHALWIYNQGVRCAVTDNMLFIGTR
jgi:hypothetical protein